MKVFGFKMTVAEFFGLIALGVVALGILITLFFKIQFFIAIPSCLIVECRQIVEVTK